MRGRSGRGACQGNKSGGPIDPPGSTPWFLRRRLTYLSVAPGTWPLRRSHSSSGLAIMTEE